MELPRIPYPQAPSSADDVARPYQEASKALGTVMEGLSAFAQEQTKVQKFKASTQLAVELQREKDKLDRKPGISARDLREFGEEYLPAEVRKELKDKDDDYSIPSWKVSESMFDRKAREAKDRASQLIGQQGWREAWGLEADADVAKLRAAVTASAMKGALETGQVDFLDNFEQSLAAGQTELARRALNETGLFGAPAKLKLEQDVKDTEAFLPARKALADNDLAAMEAALADLRKPPEKSPQEFADPVKRKSLAAELEAKLEVSKKEVDTRKANLYFENEQKVWANLNNAISVRGEKGPALFRFLGQDGTDPERGDIRGEAWHRFAQLIKDTIPDPNDPNAQSDDAALDAVHTTLELNPKMFAEGYVEIPVPDGKGGSTLEKFSFLELRRKGVLSAADFKWAENARHRAPDEDANIIGPVQLIDTILARPDYGISDLPTEQSEADRRVARETRLYVYKELARIPNSARIQGDDRVELFERLVRQGVEKVTNSRIRPSVTTAKDMLRGRKPLHGKTAEQEAEVFTSYLPDISGGLRTHYPRGAPAALKLRVYDVLHENWGTIEKEIRTGPGLAAAPLENLKTMMVLRAVNIAVGRK